MKKYRMAVCKGPDCRGNGSDKVFAASREAVAKAGLASRCELYRGGCYGLCHLGPNVVIREDTGRPKDPFSSEDFQLMGWDGEYHYQEMTPEKAARVVAEHVAEDRPVADYVAPPDETLLALKGSGS
jgi:(2Fe-2S) ferredoxin